MKINSISEAPKDTSYICLIESDGSIEIGWYEEQCWHIRNIPGGAERLGDIIKYIGWIRFSDLFAMLSPIFVKDE